MDNYSQLARFGSHYAFNFETDISSILNNLNKHDEFWSQYNPRKSIPRLGLGLINIDGKIGPGPDLDSLFEYNSENGTNYNELSFKIATPLFKECFGNSFRDIEQYIGRSHIIKLPPGGFFPIHRDFRLNDQIETFRIFLPIENCNPPKMYFIIDGNIMNFEHGTFYFIDTCLEHTLFNPSPKSDSIFAVFNVSLSAVPYLRKYMTIR
jgi:hypothetical protein